MERHQPVEVADPSSDAKVSLCLHSVGHTSCLGPPVISANALLLLIYLAMAAEACAATVWTGPRIDFSKAAQADPTQAANQDRITANVWITRGGTQGIYNAKTESSFTHFFSPADTEWANGTTANYSSLSYKDWDTWAKSINGGPPSTVGVNAVVHLKSDDIYLDLKFTSWGGTTGSFSYSRSTPSAGNAPPSIAITNPTDGTTFVGLTTLTIEATASDTDGTVTNVQFFDGATALGNASAIPYNLSVSLAAGSHTLTAVATDNLGASTTSSSVTVTVTANSPPSVAITNPIDGATFIGSANLTLQAAGSDIDGTVTNVQFFDGATALGSVSSNPYDLSISLDVGSHTFTAVATDNLGASATSPPVNVVVAGNSPPLIAITSPTNGAVFTGPATFTVQVSASDPDGTITQVQFAQDSTVLRVVTNSPYFLTISNLQAGSYTFTAIATDNLNATSTNSISITVNRPPPSPVTLLNTTLAGNDFIFSFNTQPGYTYTVEFTPALDPATWFPLTNFIGTGSLAQFSDAASTSSRYYRVGVR